jgi:dihydropteroate synthase
LRRTYALEVKGRNVALGLRTWIMGILNVTPDSFSDGGAYPDKEKAIERGLEMIEEGADIIDVGGESTRPGSRRVSEDEEMERILPVVRGLRKNTMALLSVDTMKAPVAEAALEAGADIVNDVSAFRFDPRMAGVVSGHGAVVVLMHMKGTPETMQSDPRYTDIFYEISWFLKDRIKEASSAGIGREKIIVDPGIGFGKSPADNLALIDNLGFLEQLGCPVLAGVSRKSFIGKALSLPVAERLEGSIAAGVLSIARGAHILRVHDVRAMRRAADMADAILSGKTGDEAGGDKGKGHAG